MARMTRFSIMMMYNVAKCSLWRGKGDLLKQSQASSKKQNELQDKDTISHLEHHDGSVDATQNNSGNSNKRT